MGGHVSEWEQADLWRLVVIESPYAGDINLAYLRACMRDCLKRGEAPYASHALYTQPGVLDDTVPAERIKGITAGFAWGKHAARVVVYVDLGITRGMEQGIAIAKARGIPVEERRIDPITLIAIEAGLREHA